MMRVLCPTCSGAGYISDPKCMGKSMCYSSTNGETIPQVLCQTCYGSGWVTANYASNHDAVKELWREQELEIERLRTRIRFFAQHIRGHAFFYEHGRGERFIDDIGTAVLGLIEGDDLWAARKVGGDDE